MFQNPDEQLFARNIRDELGVRPEEPRRLEGRDRCSGSTASLKRTGLEGKEDTHPYHLSLSERKRVALASVLAMETPIVVLDEPTTGQDARGVALIAKVVAELHGEGRTVVAITHDMDFCAENFDRVLVMADGKVIADGDSRARPSPSSTHSPRRTSSRRSSSDCAPNSAGRSRSRRSTTSSPSSRRTR